MSKPNTKLFCSRIIFGSLTIAGDAVSLGAIWTVGDFLPLSLLGGSDECSWRRGRNIPVKDASGRNMVLSGTIPYLVLLQLLQR